MAEIKWTDSQQLAIDTRDRTLLVSAAAGSGKTATLTERIIRSILDKDDPISITRMLIVTFTKAATAELSDKISRAIKKALAKDPENAWLAEQLRLLPSARISTIDAFCGEILRQNCERVGVSPGYRIADEAEAALLADTILDGIIEEIYRGKMPEVATAEELAYLAECLTDTKHQSDLTAELRSIHNKTKDLEDGVYRIRRLVGEYDPEKFTSVEKTRLGRHAMALVREYAEHFIAATEGHISENLGIADPKAKCSARVDVLTRDKAFLERLLGAATYEEAREIILGADLEDSKKISIPKEYKDILPDSTAMRKALKSGLADLAKTFSFSTEEWRLTYEGLYRTLSVLVRVLEEFDRAFAAEKLRLGICEFSDVSRYTYQCLWQDGKRTEIAYSEMEKYRAIYVDEYQDVNSVQHKIFEAISRADNRFMVGDIKQSIYGFRGADSTIFAELKSTYPEVTAGAPQDTGSIFMSENFRCDEGVIDFTNAIFDRVFYRLRESIGYTPEERLRFAKSYDGIEKPERRTPPVCLLPRGSGKKGVVLEGEEEYELEALVVAEKVRELIDHGKKNDGTAIKPGDIAIIMRSTTSRQASYVAALGALGIPVATMDTNTFFLKPEILLIMSILNAIDNPHRSIYLAATMMSPIFGFTAEDVTRVAKTTDGSLFTSLEKYVEEHPDFETGKRLLDFLQRYRVFAEGTSVDLLISRIYRETGILTVAEGEKGRECLNRFYEHSRQFESSSFKGLYNFINYINGIIDRKHSFDAKDANLDPEAVKIITAHSSKGLEFPVVIFSYLSYNLRPSDGGRLVYDSELGVTLRLRSRSGASLIDNPTVALVKSLIGRRAVEEEARVLYVALTRARERLICIGTANKNIEAIEADIEAARELYTPYTVYNMRNYIEMITLSAGVRITPPEELIPEMTDSLRRAIYPPEEETVGESEPETAPEEISPELDFEEAPSDDTWLVLDEDSVGTGESPDDVLYRRFTYRYPREHMTRLPEKLSVPRLYPDILDMDAEEMSLDEIVEKQSHLNMERLPAFAVGHEMTESAKRGIATHLLFQFCDFARLKEVGAEDELSRLVRERFISEEDAGRVRIREVEAFRRSALIDDILSAKRVWREQRFNVRLPAAMLTLDDELRAKLTADGCEVLVQGVIDCLYEDGEGKLHLVDYKTDRLSYEERQSPALAEAKLRAAHSEQLGYYTEAVKRMFGRAPETVEVYSLQLARCVDVKQ